MMRKTIAAATVAVGGVGVLGLGATAMVGAQDEPSSEAEAGWVEDALGGLVEDGTITQEQADAVEEALEDAHPGPGLRGGFGHHPGWFGFGGDLSTLADSLGLDEDELRSELREGKTIAEVAEEQDVDVADVVDDIVEAQQERVDEAVANGDLTQDEADDIMAGAEARVTAFVNGEWPGPEEMPDLPFDGPGHRWDGRGPWDDGDAPRWRDERSPGDDPGDSEPSAEGTTA
jgi:polyhydroxyalkanoate synthesis regulator phasin